MAAPLTAPLRFKVAGAGQILGKSAITVPSTSTTTLAIDVARDRAPCHLRRHRTVSHADLDLSTALDDERAAGRRRRPRPRGVRVARRSSRIDVTTVYDESAALLKTTRSTNRSDGFAAVADLVLTTTDADDNASRCDYSALPTDSSGGGGAAQPAPEAMQVKYIAEGLDGLATALGNALDGGGRPQHRPGRLTGLAPLIGTDLDAGADVAGILTGLTCALRDELARVDADNPEDLVTEVQDAVDAAVAGADGITAGDPAAATVPCNGACARRRRPDGVGRGHRALRPRRRRAWTTQRPSTSAWPA